MFVDGKTPSDLNQQYIQNLSAFYTLCTLETKMELRGNPDLMTQVSLQNIPAHVSATAQGANGTLSSTNTSVKAQYRADFERNVLNINPGGIVTPGSQTNRNFVTTPVFAKINIFGPNVDFTTNEQKPGGYTQQLFYNAFYIVTMVTSKIDGSSFTQEVALRAFEVYTQANTTAQGSAAPRVCPARH